MQCKARVLTHLFRVETEIIEFFKTILLLKTVFRIIVDSISHALRAPTQWMKYLSCYTLVFLESYFLDIFLLFEC